MVFPFHLVSETDIMQETIPLCRLTILMPEQMKDMCSEKRLKHPGYH